MAAAAATGAAVIGAELSELNHRPSGAATEGEVMELEVDDLGMPIHPGACLDIFGEGARIVANALALPQRCQPAPDQRILDNESDVGNRFLCLRIDVTQARPSAAQLWSWRMCTKLTSLREAPKSAYCTVSALHSKQIPQLACRMSFTRFERESLSCCAEHLVKAKQRFATALGQSTL